MTKQSQGERRTLMYYLLYNKYQKLFSQLLSENEYLRYSNERVIGSWNREVSTNNYGSNTQTTEKDVNDITEAKQKKMHKRQKTQYNFQNNNLKINTIESNDKTEYLNTSSSVNTVVDDRVCCMYLIQSSSTSTGSDLFNMTLTDLVSNKTMKRVHNSDTSSPDKKEEKNSNLPPTNKGANQKPVYLFYRTPSNKENKKIDFTFNSENNA